MAESESGAGIRQLPRLRDRASHFQPALECGALTAILGVPKMHARAFLTFPLSPAVNTARPAAQQASIAVLAFADMSAAKDQEYFSAGMTEEIINALVNTDGLKVAGRTSITEPDRSALSILRTVAQQAVIWYAS
jgi:hypothetical protein